MRRILQPTKQRWLTNTNSGKFRLDDETMRAYLQSVSDPTGEFYCNYTEQKYTIYTTQIPTEKQNSLYFDNLTDDNIDYLAELAYDHSMCKHRS